MNATELWEWAIRAQVWNELEVGGYGSVDPLLIDAVKIGASTVMLWKGNPAEVEGSIDGLNVLRATIEERAGTAHAEREQTSFSKAFGFDPMANFPKLR